MTTKDRSKCGVELSWAYEMRYICCGWQSWRWKQTNLFGAQKIVSDETQLHSWVFGFACILLQP